jgi:HD-like signal output (HDOD) protein
MSGGTTRHPDVQTLKQFHFLDFLREDQRELLARTLIVKEVRKRNRLVQRGDTADFSLLLLKGRVRLDDGRGGVRELSAGNEMAAGPIAPELPRRYAVTALEDVTYLEIDNRLLRGLRGESASGEKANPGVLALATDDGVEQLILQRVREDLQANSLRLPSLPEVALRVGRAMDEENTDARKIAALIQNDPAITVKVIWVANSAFYPGNRSITTCADAVVRLGFRTTYQLVLTLALREVFNTRVPALRTRMHTLWSHSVKVAAVCYVLARHLPKFDSEHALLCGLVHDIGVVALLAYAEEYPSLVADEDALQRAVDALRAETGSAVLEHWGFPPSLVACSRYADDWNRDHEPPAQYCDLVVIAQLQLARGTPEQERLPALDSVPAYRSLQPGPLNESGDLEILRSAQDQLSLAESLLSP